MQILSYVKGTIPEQKLPIHWWRWEHRRDGTVCKVSKYPKLFDTTDKNRFIISASIAERQHNKVHNKFWSDLRKKQSIENTYNKAARNLRYVTDMVLKVANGKKTPSEVFAYFFPNNKKKYELEYIEEKLGPIFGILKSKTKTDVIP